jgi:DNA-binding NtrC family response regulator
MLPNATEGKNSRFSSDHELTGGLKREPDATTLRGSDEAHEETSVEAIRLEIVFSPDSAAVGAAELMSRERTLILGRDVANGRRIRDPRLSRLHVRVVWDPVARAYRYGDADSANGTFVNGYRSASGLLMPNDVMRVGDTLIVCAEATPDDVFALRTRAAGRSGLPVLICGETGSGKEVLARALHRESGRAGEFVGVNCAALPPELAATELFGHTRGAFSGAQRERPGLFRSAEGGTLLLDEVGDLPFELQGHLLRVLQERRVRPVGSDRDLGVDVRVMAATHVDLEAAVRAGRFRADLLSRLRQIVLAVAPLRLRRREIVPLIAKLSPGVALTASAIEALMLCDWPGNVRELKAVLDGVSALRDGAGTIRLRDLADRIPTAARVLGREPPQERLPPRQSAAARRHQLWLLLEKHDGNIAGVARELGKPRSQIYRWLRTLGLPRAVR